MEKFPVIHPIPRASSSGMSHLGLNNMLSYNNTNKNHAHAAATAYNSEHHFQSNKKPNNFLELMANMEEVQSSTETNNNTVSDIISMDLSHHQSTNGGFGDGNDLQLIPTGDKKKGSEKKVRKPRYAFQTRSRVDILDDGYRWRKYGQKAVKNNKFPRSYYRCTHQGCNVKKQVQRLSKDEEIVVTTYEGIHSHPIEKSTDNFEHILSQMQIYTSF